MRKYKYLVEEKSKEEIQDKIKKLKLSNEQLQIDLKYLKSEDPKYSERKTSMEDRIKQNKDKINELNQELNSLRSKS